jgi:hypothetical protein
MVASPMALADQSYDGPLTWLDTYQLRTVSPLTATVRTPVRPCQQLLHRCTAHAESYYNLGMTYLIYTGIAKS